MNSIPHNTALSLQYSNLVSVCNDLVNSLCSPSRVVSIRQDAITATSDSLLRVEAWSKAVSAAIDKLNSEEYMSLIDVLHPFSTGLQLVWHRHICDDFTIFKEGMGERKLKVHYYVQHLHMCQNFGGLVSLRDSTGYFQGYSMPKRLLSSLCSILISVHFCPHLLRNLLQRLIH